MIIRTKNIQLAQLMANNNNVNLENLIKHHEHHKIKEYIYTVKIGCCMHQLVSILKNALSNVLLQ